MLKRLCMPETGCSVSTRFVAEGHLERVELDDLNLCAEYKLPFSILADNAQRPFDYARQDSNLRPSV